MIQMRDEAEGLVLRLALLWLPKHQCTKDLHMLLEKKEKKNEQKCALRHSHKTNLHFINELGDCITKMYLQDIPFGNAN